MAFVIVATTIGMGYAGYMFGDKPALANKPKEYQESIRKDPLLKRPMNLYEHTWLGLIFGFTLASSAVYISKE